MRARALPILLLTLAWSCAPEPAPSDEGETTSGVAVRLGQWTRASVRAGALRRVQLELTPSESVALTWTDDNGAPAGRRRPRCVLDVQVTTNDGVALTDVVHNSRRNDNGLEPDPLTFRVPPSGRVTLVFEEVDGTSDDFEYRVDRASEPSPSPAPSPSPTPSARELDPGPVPRGLTVATGGNAEWVTRATRRGVTLVGGGAEPDEALRWLLERGGFGDVVVLRMGDGGGAYVPYLLGLGADSVHELSFDAVDGDDDVGGTSLDDLRRLANSDYVARVVLNAEVIFLAGGNQTKYYDVWHDTALARAVTERVQVRGAPIGGTSAGMHSLARIIHTPRGEGDSVLSADALADPYLGEAEVEGSRALDFEERLFVVPELEHVVTDTHFSERNRLGRAVVFLARTVADGRAPLSLARALAADEGTAVCIDERGVARVFGATGETSGRTGRTFQDFAYVLRPLGAPTVCRDDTPLEWPAGVEVVPLPGYRDGRTTFDLRAWSGAVGLARTITVRRGVLSADVQTPD